MTASARCGRRLRCYRDQELATPSRRVADATIIAMPLPHPRADTDPCSHTQALAQRADGSYVVEYREGDARQRYGTAVVDTRAAHQLLIGWTFRLLG